MEIYSFKNQEDNKKIKELMKKLIQSRHLIPVIGSGFTAGTDTKSGTVPNMLELENQMIDLLLKTDDYREMHKEEFGKVSMSLLTPDFWRKMNKYNNLRRRFIEYVEANFTNVRDLPAIKRKFLNSGWRYIYTLNYDDAIENVLEMAKIVPYGKQNMDFIEQHNCLFKLHGDARKFLETSDEKYFILSQRQYIDSMKADENYIMCKHLESDFAANSLLFVGCSLTDELDLLFAAENGLEAKANLNKDEAKIVFIRYCGSDLEIPFEERLKYENYGITHVINITDNDEMDFFYKLIRDLFEQCEQIEKEDELERYKGIYIKQLAKEDERNLQYFFTNDSIAVKNGQIFLPGFFVERNIVNKIYEELDDEQSIYIITGARFSGKTYALLQLLRKLPPERTYYLSIAVNDEILDRMLDKMNCIYLLDKQSLKASQIKRIFTKIPLLRKNRNTIILTVNSDDKEFLNFYLQRDSANGNGVKFYNLKNKFESGEIERFNDCVGRIRLVDYQEKNTLLDYIFRVDEMLIKRRKRILPPICFLNYTDIDKLKAMIVLAVKNVVPLSMANWLGIDDTLLELSSEYPITVQKDYLSEIESTIDYSRYKFVNNSPYWVIKCLAKCAESSVNHKAIAEAFYSLTSEFHKRYPDMKDFNNAFKEYYMLDTLQTLFSNPNLKGTVQLPYIIYEKLHARLFNNYQFLHQEAKCELRVARRKKLKGDILEIIQKAFSNINRAIDLTDGVNGENIAYTQNHMEVTKALILSNYFLLGEQSDKIEETIKAYYEAFIEQANLLEENFLKRDDLKDVRAFLNCLLEQGTSLDLSEQGKERFGEIYFQRFGMHVRIE